MIDEFQDIGEILTYPEFSVKQKAALLKKAILMLGFTLGTLPINVIAYDTWEALDSPSPSDAKGISKVITALTRKKIEDELSDAFKEQDPKNIASELEVRKEITDILGTKENRIALEEALKKFFPTRLAAFIKDIAERKTAKGAVELSMKEEAKPLEKRIALKIEKAKRFPAHELSFIFHAATSDATPIKIQRAAKLLAARTTPNELAALVPFTLDLAIDILIAVVKDDPKSAVEAINKRNVSYNNLGVFLQKVEDTLDETGLLPDLKAMATVIKSSRRKKASVLNPA